MVEATPASEPRTPPADAAAGAAVYSKALLAVYDLEVLGIELRFVFGCPAQRMVALYDRHVSGRHLDVGVGTGYFLDKCRFPVERPVLHLMDLNPNSLQATARRVARYQPVPHLHNALEPIGERLPQFDSIGACNFLHCLPGPLEAKEPVFTHLLPHLNKGGVFFGTTVLGKGVESTGRLYRAANAVYNRKAIFSNLEDDAEGLDRLLARNFGRHTLEVVGSIALFAAWK
jgi:hypothetical protein